MTNHLNAILLGCGCFPFFAILMTLPIFAITIIKYKTVNPVRIGLNYFGLLYFLCLIAVVFFPLPTMEQAQQLSGHEFQSIPFHFICDIIKDNTLDITRPATYLKGLYNTAVLQIICNILMTVPFGMLLRYYFGVSGKKIVIITCLLSLVIEIAQLTGLFGIYKGSYRLCDVDDLMANTLGGYVGYRLVHAVEAFVPSIHQFDLKRFHKGHKLTVE